MTLATNTRLQSQTIAIIGATGAVGLEALSILAARGVPASNIRAIASERSAGTSVPFGLQFLTVRSLTPGSFAGADLAIFAADATIAREFVPLARAAGATVIDNSSAFRLDPNVPLVVPEINGDLLRDVPRRGALVANPNCSAAILLVALEPLRRAFGIERVVVATYQAVSGAGLAAVEELRAQCRAALAGEELAPSVFKEPCAFNLFSHDSAVDESDGLNGEERKIIDECRKIWDAPTLRVTPTCVRVPVIRAHSQAIVALLDRAASVHEVREALSTGVGVRVIDDRRANAFPTPQKASGGDDVLVGRIRLDPSSPIEPRGGDGVPRSRSVCLFACGDKLRKGAALNAVHIAEAILSHRCSAHESLLEPTTAGTKNETPALTSASC